MRNDDSVHNVSAMLVFAAVVESGGFSAAARRLGLSKASVSREVAALERRLGAQLLRRTTRRMSLTEVGQVFHARCQRVAEEAEQAQQAVGQLQAEPRGEVRLAAPMSFGHREVAPRLCAFASRYPKLRVHVDLTDRKIDLIEEKFDLSVRIGERVSEGGTLVQRRLCPIRLALCAAPSYLERAGTPADPEALGEHNCLGYTAPPERWSFSGGRRIPVRGDLNIDNGDGLRQLALEGHGIVYLPRFLVAADLRAGHLVSILEEHVDLEGGAFAVYPESRHLSPKVRALIDYLAESFGTEPEWERGGPA